MMKRATRAFMIVAILLAGLAGAQTPRSRYDPGAGPLPVQKKGFLEWTLSQINPGNIDYGARIEAMRQNVFDDTVRDPQWRARTLLIAGLFGLFIAYCWELRTNGSLRISVARVITVCQNELVMAHGQIAKLTAEYAQAKRVLDDQMETALAMRAAARRREDGTTTSKKEGAAASAGDGPQTVDQLQVENNSLKQQVKTLTAKWQEEQQRNRKLKGE